jgi:hypothetical protein
VSVSCIGIGEGRESQGSSATELLALSSGMFHYFINNLSSPAGRLFDCLHDFLAYLAGFTRWDILQLALQLASIMEVSVAVGTGPLWIRSYLRGGFHKCFEALDLFLERIGNGTRQTAAAEAPLPSIT